MLYWEAQTMVLRQHSFVALVFLHAKWNGSLMGLLYMRADYGSRGLAHSSCPGLPGYCMEVLLPHISQRPALEPSKAQSTSHCLRTNPSDTQSTREELHSFTREFPSQLQFPTQPNDLNRPQRTSKV